jgi:hypothetical protein
MSIAEISRAHMVDTAYASFVLEITGVAAISRGPEAM